MLTKIAIVGMFISVLFLKDDKACAIFRDNLVIIKECVEKKKEMNASVVQEAIAFFERVTLIKSNSDGNYFGKFNPTNQDYNNWNNWFEKNKSRLYWDKKEKIVKTKRI